MYLIGQGIFTVLCLVICPGFPLLVFTFVVKVLFPRFLFGSQKQKKNAGLEPHSPLSDFLVLWKTKRFKGQRPNFAS